MPESKHAERQDISDSQWETVLEFDPSKNFSVAKFIYENLDGSNDCNFRTQARWDKITGWKTVGSSTTVSSSDEPKTYESTDETPSDFRVQAQGDSNPITQARVTVQTQTD